jgi:hypothetical protein
MLDTVRMSRVHYDEIETRRFGQRRIFPPNRFGDNQFTWIGSYNSPNPAIAFMNTCTIPATGSSLVSVGAYESSAVREIAARLMASLAPVSIMLARVFARSCRCSRGLISAIYGELLGRSDTWYH